MTRRRFTGCSIAVLAPLTACASRDFITAVPAQVRASKMCDAKTQVVRGFPYFRVNAWLLDQLARVERTENVDIARRELLGAVEAAYALAEDSVNNELDCLPADDVGRLWRRHFADSPPHDVRTELKVEFWRIAQGREAALVAEIEAATVAELHRRAAAIRHSARASPKDHHGSGLILAMVSNSIKDTVGPLDRGSPTVDIYRPDDTSMATSSGSSDDALLRRFAPIIVQERRLDAPYDPNADRIGTVGLRNGERAEEVLIDTSAPSVYAYARQTLIHAEPHTQLTYVHWFPEHPRRGAGKDDCGCAGAVKTKTDLEAGRIDGGTLRITLDRSQRPILFETILNCGCYHRCFPARTIEDAACTAHGGPLSGKRFCLEQDMARKKDWILPETVDVSLGETGRPILFSRAGYHGLVAVAFNPSDLDTRRVLESRHYTLRDYGELERLPLDGGFGSMFQPNGLVRGAERPEGRLMAITGMLSAGQPRQRGTQLIHWDDYDFDDPHLWERCLRLPPGL